MRIFRTIDSVLDGGNSTWWNIFTIGQGGFEQTKKRFLKITRYISDDQEYGLQIIISSVIISTLDDGLIFRNI